MLVAGVVEDQVEDDPDPSPVRLGDEPIEVRLGPEQRIDRPVVADVIAEVESGRRVDRRQPEGVDAETGPAQVVEVVDDTRQVADAVAVAVGKAARVDLVDDATLPPVVAEAGRLHGDCMTGEVHVISLT